MREDVAQRMSAALGVEPVAFASARGQGYKGNRVMDVAGWLPSLSAEGGPAPEEILPGEPEAASFSGLLRRACGSAAADGPAPDRCAARATPRRAPVGGHGARVATASPIPQLTGEAPVDRPRPVETERVGESFRHVELVPRFDAPPRNNLRANLLVPQGEDEVDPAW